MFSVRYSVFAKKYVEHLSYQLHRFPIRQSAEDTTITINSVNNVINIVINAITPTPTVVTSFYDRSTNEKVSSYLSLFTQLPTRLKQSDHFQPT